MLITERLIKHTLQEGLALFAIILLFGRVVCVTMDHFVDCALAMLNTEIRLPDTKILHFFAVILLLGWVLVMLNTEIRRA